MTPDDRSFRNPGHESRYWAPEPFLTITDIELEPLPTERFGVHMIWRSASHGVITEFPWWDNLERNPRLDDPTWWPVGSESEHYFDADEDWVFECWADDEFVYVVERRDIASWERRFRVPRDIFLAAWRDRARKIKASAPPLQIENGGASFRP